MEAALAIANPPGHWEYFISHTQRDEKAKLLAFELYTGLQSEGHTCWLDVVMADKSEKAMQEGVVRSRVVICVLTEQYFEREYCLKELRWATQATPPVPIKPVVRAEDKQSIGSFLANAPEDLQFLGGIDIIHFDRSDAEYRNLGLQKLIRFKNELATGPDTVGQLQASLQWKAPLPLALHRTISSMERDEVAKAKAAAFVASLADDTHAVEELLKKRSLSAKGTQAEQLKRLQAAIMEEETTQAAERVQNQKWTALADDLLASRKFVRATEETVDVLLIDGLHTAVFGYGTGRILQSKKASKGRVELQIGFEEGGVQTLTLEPTSTGPARWLIEHRRSEQPLSVFLAVAELQQYGKVFSKMGECATTLCDGILVPPSSKMAMEFLCRLRLKCLLQSQGFLPKTTCCSPLPDCCSSSI